MPAYEIEFKPQAWKDLNALPKRDAKRIYSRVERMREGLVGNIKRLTNFRPSYRLRVGNFRVLFEVEGDKIVAYRIRDRKDAYD
jgi:mRNA interferase RelE/StbE